MNERFQVHKMIGIKAWAILDLHSEATTAPFQGLTLDEKTALAVAAALNALHLEHRQHLAELVALVGKRI